MTMTRRTFLTSTLGIGSALTLLPNGLRAAGEQGNTFHSSAGDITVHPIQHASVVIETPFGAVYVDPVGDMTQYAGMPPADLVLVTHEHGDHFSNDVLTAIVGDDTTLISNPGAEAKMTPALQARAKVLANGGSTGYRDIRIDAVPAYNLTDARKNFHPQGRDNGYVLTIGDFRIYISGDTEDTPEMRALKDIDLAFLCMNLPFTMDIKQAASAVADFKPRYVYPYHYRGREGGTQDPAAFAALVGDGTEVKLAKWYG